MWRYSLVIIVVTVCGCLNTKQRLTLAHDVDVPKAFRSGSFSKDHPFYFQDGSDCTIARYVLSYEYGWIAAVECFSTNINFDAELNPLRMNGWEEEAVGAANGFDDASRRIESLIRAYGKQKVSEFLTKEWPPQCYLHSQNNQLE